MKIALGADHAGYPLKNSIKEFLDNQGFVYTDFGTFKISEGNYPEYAYKVADVIVQGQYDRGILVGTMGIGMCIAANKLKGIRAAVIQDREAAQQSRLFHDVNVLCLGANYLEEAKALDIVEIWLNTSFEGGKYQNWVSLISKLTGL